MISPLWLIPIAAAVEIPLALAIRAGAEKKEAPQVDEQPAGVDNWAVWGILMNAYTKLRKGGFSVRHPWIAGCIVEIEKGGDCPADVAALAVRKTADDLYCWGCRKDFGFLFDAERELSEL